jgi:hypothetical protein
LLPQEVLKKNFYKIYPALNNICFPSEVSNLDSFNVRLANGVIKVKMLYDEEGVLFSFTKKKERNYYLDF